MPISPTGILINRSGFTLVELLIVVVLLSLISVISLPLMENLGGGNERLVLRRIAGTVKQLYNEATLTRDEHLLTFDLDRNSLLTFRLRSSSGMVEKESFGRELMLAPLQIEQIDVKGKGTFLTGQVSVRIFPLGWMEQATLVLRKENGTKVQIVFSPLTGSITIDDEYATVR